VRPDVSSPENTDEARHGFTLKDTGSLDLIGARLELYEHNGTGAQVVFLLNEDINRVFEMTFRTPAEDDRGIPHVFEHSTLSGSRKYPAKSLFFNLSARTYNTYMNAGTYNFMTTYPVASMSEAQLLKYADYYTDSCLNPMVYEDESIFMEEAWRYAKESEDSPLYLAGTVYSEMQGAMDISAWADLNFKKNMLPGSTYANESGGLPNEILKLSWQDMKDYHSAYYHPSNSITVIYGKIEDRQGFLDLLDGYFSGYDRVEYNIQDANYNPIRESVSMSCPFGLAEGADTENGSYIDYGFLLGNLPKEECFKLDMLTTLLNDSGSVFSRRMKDEFPSADYGCYYDFSGPEVFVEFYAQGVGEDEAERFRELVDSSMEQIYEEGFDAAAVDAIAASTVLDVMLMTESSSVGVRIIPTLLYYYYGMGDLYAFMDYVEALNSFKDYYEDGTLSDCMKAYLMECDRRALVTTYPVAGLKDQEDAALLAELADKEASMSAGELAAIIARTAAMDEEKEDDSSEYVKQLQAVTVDNLPVEVRIYDYSDEVGADGVRRMDVYASVNGVGTANVLLDAGGLHFGQLQYFKLFTTLLGELDTTEHSYEELSALITRYLYNGDIKVSLMYDEEGECLPYLRAEFTALDEDLKGGYDLLSELIFKTDFSDTVKLKNLISGFKNSLKRSINAEPYIAQMRRAMSYSTDVNAYYDYVNYLPYYDFLSEIEAKMESNPNEVADNLIAVQEYFNNSSGAVLAYAGSKESAAVNRPIADAFISSLENRELSRPVYAFPLICASEAIIVDSSVMYNMAYANFVDLGLISDEADSEELDFGALMILCSFVQDKYMYPQLRDRYGAYGAFCDVTEDGVYLLSYRDPNVLETFQVYMDLPEWMESNKDVDQETLNDYILSTFAYMATPAGELSGAQSAILSMLSATPQEYAIDMLEEIKGVNVDKFNQYSGIFADMMDYGVISSSGSIAKINENDNLYDDVLNPFGTVDKSNLYRDIERGNPYYAALQYVVGGNLMDPQEETVFGSGEKGSVGDFALALTRGFGYPEDTAEEAIDWLAEYTLWPKSAPDKKITREELAYYAANLCEALGVPVSSETLDAPDAGSVSSNYQRAVAWIVSSELMLPREDGSVDPKAEATREEIAYMIYMLFSE